MTNNTPNADLEMCAKCGFTFNGHVSNTGVIYPCWMPSGTYAKATSTPYRDIPSPSAERDAQFWIAELRENGWGEAAAVITAALLAARADADALRAALEQVEESLNHPDLADADERCDEIAMTVAAALAATPERDTREPR